MRTIAALRGWTSGQIEMLSIILAPSCHDGAMIAETPATLMGEFDEDWDSADGEAFVSHVETISSLLRNHLHNNRAGAAYGFAFECSTDRVIQGANITATIGHQPHAITLVEYLGWDDLSTDQHAKGAHGAAAIAEALHDAFMALLDKARQHHLLT